MSQDAQRKAWNEAMRAAAGASANFLPTSLQPHARRSDRRKRRDKARTSSSAVMAGNDADDDYRSVVWMDALEQVLQDEDEEEPEEEYNEFDELQQPSQRKRARKNKPKVGQIPKRFKARSLASILHEETTRSDGVALAFVQAGCSVVDTLPRRPFCPVTGLPGLYREPKSALAYANDRALEQIKERAPPWNTMTGAAVYNDVVKSLLASTSE
ncbi:YL1 nuclear protein C-terminal domain [Fragilaria crotonensis]|nr:YL1 nuclear protein C-terminal domain [Fragilaria crotonensis]